MSSKFFRQSQKYLAAYRKSARPFFEIDTESWASLFQQSVWALRCEINSNNLYPALMIHVALHKLIEIMEGRFDIGTYIESRADLDWDRDIWYRSLKGNHLAAAFDSRLGNDVILRQALQILCRRWPWERVSSDQLEILLLWMTPSGSGKKVPLSDLQRLLADSRTPKKLNRIVSEYLKGTRPSLLPIDAALKENLVIYQSGGPYKVQMYCYLIDRENVVGDGRGLKIEIPLISGAQFRKERMDPEMLYRYIEQLEFEEAPEEKLIAKKGGRKL